MKVLLGDLALRLDLRKDIVLSIKDIGFRNCITPGCTRTFRRQLNSPCTGGEKEHHSNQCATWHMNMKRRIA
jgi:hypothetical protein